ncbi:MAG TPA: hypothetical protein VFU36_02185, partial [Jatrophihabitans sp.]|nr:hypothetical protein [Jatrophihabitans sp.]
MTSRRIRTASAAAALVTAAALALPATARATAPAYTDTGTGTGTVAAAPTVTPAAAGAAAVVLPTGDRLIVHNGTGARSGLSVESTPGASDSLASFQAGGDRYVIPSEAEPYLGHSLDLSLFD